MSDSKSSSTRREFLATGGLALGTAALAGTALGGPVVEETHPRLRTAIRDLHGAEKYLKEAPHDFGGHRERAVELIGRTIRQLEICLKY
jgi:hypothetical protein